MAEIRVLCVYGGMAHPPLGNRVDCDCDEFSPLFRCTPLLPIRENARKLLSSEAGDRVKPEDGIVFLDLFADR